MHSVVLHAARHAVNALQKEGKQRRVILLRQQSVGVVELLDVVGAIVGRHGDPAEDNFGSRSLQSADNLRKIFACRRDGKTAKSVVTSERNDDNFGVESDHCGQPFDAVLRGITADAGVHHVIFVAACVQVSLKIVWITLTDVSSVTGSKRVAEGYDDGPFIWSLSRNRSWSRGW